MEPVSAIANAVSDIFGGVVALIEGRRESKFGRLPDWLSPRDFQRNDYTVDIIIGAMLLVLIIVIIGITRAK
ncbi:MAG: hypothetical protein KDC85_18325 [Saprospiraceae bacterium]|nr:hypothetical protein [Saprospiraceae bacterium]MCB9325892.1 hypothetical protein [Lewinellaceae bacterium]